LKQKRIKKHYGKAKLSFFFFVSQETLFCPSSEKVFRPRRHVAFSSPRSCVIRVEQRGRLTDLPNAACPSVCPIKRV
jgi:hypothetical protein